MRGKWRAEGFSTIELLVAVAIIGILAAIGISSYFGALHKSRQKRTMADIRGIAVAWEARAVDVKQYNAASAAVAMPPVVITHADLRSLLAPTYLANVPQFDGWGYALDYRLDQGIGSGRPGAEYMIRSPGRDNQHQATYDPGPTTSFDCDIVYSNGSFVVWPEGTQQ